MKFKLRESSSIQEGTSRIFGKLMDDTTNVAIISPYRSENTKEQNNAKMWELKDWVRNKLGSGFTQFVSRWVEDGQAFDEQSLMISPITFDEAMKAGERFKQSSIIFKDATSCKEYCTTPFEDNGTFFEYGDVVREYNLSGDHPFNIRDAEEIFAKRRGGPVSMPVKGSNKKPFTLKVNSSEEEDTPMVESFELHEVLSPRASTFDSIGSFRTSRIF